MGKAAHTQPLFQLPVSAVLVLPERRFLHCCNQSCKLVDRQKISNTDDSHLDARAGQHGQQFIPRYALALPQYTFYIPL